MKQDDCRTVRENLSALLDGELAPEERSKAEGHLSLCDLCKREFQQLAGAVQTLLEWDGVTPSETFDRQFHKKLEKRKALRREKRAWVPAFIRHIAPPYPAVLATAMAVLVLIFGALFFSVQERPLSLYEIGLTEHLELFQNFEVIHYSDGLEHFELINALDDIRKKT